MSKNLTIGCRIPKDYFISKGKGSSDIAYHAGAYHLMLKECGIEMMNIMTYSSILPKIANKIDKPSFIEHGCVGECIMSTTSGKKDELISTGIIYGWLYNKETKQKFGGLVCENGGNYSIEELSNLLKSSLYELYYNGFSENYDLIEDSIELNIESFVGEKQYNCVGVSLTFVNYEVPIL